MSRKSGLGKCSVYVLALLFVISVFSVADAATVNGSDDYATTPDNWNDGTTNRAPGVNDDVLFDSTLKN